MDCPVEPSRNGCHLQYSANPVPTYTAGVGQSVDPFNCGILLNGLQWLLSKSQSWRGLPPSPPTRPRNRVVPVCPHRGTRTSCSATKLVGYENMLLHPGAKAYPTRYSCQPQTGPADRLSQNIYEWLQFSRDDDGAPRFQHCPRNVVVTGGPQVIAIFTTTAFIAINVHPIAINVAPLLPVATSPYNSYPGM